MNPAHGNGNGEEIEAAIVAKERLLMLSLQAEQKALRAFVEAAMREIGVETLSGVPPRQFYQSQYLQALEGLIDSLAQEDPAMAARRRTELAALQKPDQ